MDTRRKVDGDMSHFLVYELEPVTHVPPHARTDSARARERETACSGGMVYCQLERV